ncbi:MULTISPECIES: hypothetical protein [Leeuwenhoekiella]|jgi:hypothetical protein|uniref:Uncharacterized protein n=1 Tax=Leeuwenhoekiella blandensis (strain CECT 7118 / CCUG 51940 / KCTC 22103 / MED217) TaxID=398720 RepID=A3XQ32_LEEBM|nr:MULTISPECIES: hypothetical protein [Leeuwenhoekiella]EAQ48340.1 hypothetical protein MED217_01040 [Leeuwenhoekiella blandensis MED217]MAO43884.1 hypothetical protein [Leeuwenhoekiella sp.]MBQ52636.1 hypothetical protein [Leeuwenhoekiella sp.]HBT10520.1 hypothetical protein [Leeuwenhoekiella sp.]HCW63587.1 hypothetical protein [Leeuwenhoekiella sp.]|tara:strand:+ start:267697 stop:267912 length:216 start_codon:yes stop_codon:yes gene_type:complete
MWTKTKILKQLEHLPEEFSIDQLIEQLLNSEDEGVRFSKEDLISRVNESEDDYTQGRVQSLKDLNKTSETW